MPLGISESTIKGAYGALDLGGVYKAIDTKVKQLAAEEKLYRQQNMKTYMQDSLKLTEAAKGVRAKDGDEIMHHRNNWKNLKMIQDSDPLLIQTDKKSYFALQKKIDDAYASAINLSNQSRDWKKEEDRIFAEMGQKPEMYEEGARERWQKDVMGKPYTEIINSGAHDIGKYTNKTPDFDKMLESYRKEIKPANLVLGPVEYNPTNQKESRQVKFHNLPVYGDYLANAVESLRSKGTHNAAAYGTKLLGTVSDADFNETVQRFNQIMKDGSAKSKAAIHEGLAQDEYATVGKNDEISIYGTAATAAKYMSMKKFINDYDKASVEVPEYKYASESEKMLESSRLAESRAEAAWNRRIKQLGLTDAGGSLDIKPVFDTISRGGKPGQAQIKNLITGLNSNPLIPADATMIGYNVEKKDGKTRKAPYSKEQDVHGNYKNSSKVLDNLIPEWKNLSEEEIAKKMNESNIDNVGLVSANIDAESVRTGKVMSFNWSDAAGNKKHVFLDTQDPASADYLDKLLKSKVYSKKQKAAAAIGLTTDVEGAFDNIQ